MIDRGSHSSRHDERISRIVALSRQHGITVNLDYLYSCDLRALPLLLYQLEIREQRRRRPLFGRRDNEGRLPGPGPSL